MRGGPGFFIFFQFFQQCPVWILLRRMLVIRPPTIHKFANAYREDYFPLTLTLSPIGERGKDGTDLRLCHHKDLSYPLSPPLRGERVGVRGGE
jgi:hypothetical protein